MIMEYVIPPTPAVAVPVAGSNASFPVRRVYCVGRNYAEHAKEMGFTGREEPFFFNKPADAIVFVPDGDIGSIPYPPRTTNLHYEMELVVVLAKGGKDIPVDQANECVWGYALGLDMTRRDLQGEAKKQGRPWEVGKGFDFSAPIGPIHPRSVVGTLNSGAIWLDLNGERKQSSDISQMIWNIPESIAFLSTLFELQPGDIIFTGTPEGVGAVVQGDEIVGGIDGLGELRLRIA
ncbi:FAH family protein [Bordetella holmesii CDC-H635-BH]|uniref:FAH family protein n=2 Tax=Bordetella holmesii TaxID=35814 RepID=A0A158M3K4_9BORD|nr:FAH family protein [Bordetella holmesii H620]KAK80118.1 FAH family protein [Bordetella holmesii CDC-H809-BH]KAK80955.1 FAH family protein [Bordetella holmesii CDC-H572-BH]KAK90025.1 FAH family protein [Bordetella holmesii CDC-H635-BH]KAK90417.1 FAH family protein [Bordetella holmesii CDC-H585-BH]KCV03516.1 FAH family protein [Bordetella holmesii CDC-H719-BH]KCV07859.1 FAH family protein [Bordetella holmesii CDC-H629-BH]KCV09944.1 FAH family protein [Bordetella holmesii CDC-H785-BH]KCV133